MRGSYSTSTGILLLLQARPVETHRAWNGAHPTEGEEEVSVLVWHIPLAVYLLMPANATSPAQHIWYTQLGPVPKL